MAASSPVSDEGHSIVVSNLTKLYGDFKALDSISFSVDPGEIVGFLGPNGAGKTTTMKILTCFMAANGGTASVAGYDVHSSSEEVRKRIGYLPENVPLYEDMIVYDYLKFIAEVRGVPGGERHAQIKRVAEMTGLSHMISREIRELSKGYRQRVGLAQAIIHEPDVVVLDEPTSGLDPNQIVEIRDVVKEIGREKTVIFSTHILQEVAAVCDRIIIIHRGRIIADSTLEGLSEKLTELRPGLVASFDSSTSQSELMRVLGELPQVARLHMLEHDDEAFTFRLETRDEETLRATLYQMAADGELQLRQLQDYRPSLEEIFRHFTDDDIADAELGAREKAQASKPQGKLSTNRSDEEE